jgi:transposase InsO family protein
MRSVAFVLSRTTIVIILDPTDDHEFYSVAFAELEAIQLSELQQEYQRDPIAARIIRRIIEGKWTECTQAETSFKKVSDFLTVEEDVIYNGTRPYIPPRLRTRIISRAHETHPGVNTTQNMVKLMSWWPGLHLDVERYVNSCSKCLTLRPRLEKSVDQWPEAKPWERLHMDWAHIPEVGNILIIVDAGTGWIEAFICGDRPTENVIKRLSAIFARFGVPFTLVSDNAKEFVTDHVTTWLRVQGCSKLETPIYHPRANGLAERAVQTVKRAMTAWQPSLRVSFHAFLQRVLFTHRNTSNARNKTPAELLIGRQLRLPAVISYPLCDNVLFRAGPKTATSPATYIMRKGTNTAWICPEGSDRTVLASTSQISHTPAKEGDAGGCPTGQGVVLEPEPDVVPSSEAQILMEPVPPQVMTR